MRAMSFRDLKLIPQLSHLSEIEMLFTANDELVNACLYELGFDPKAPILYIPSKHRDMQNKVAVGFRAVGQITTDRKFLRSALCTPVERLIAASRTDMSLTYELAKLMGSSIEFKDDGAFGEAPEFDGTVEPDYLKIEKEIKDLEDLRDHIRGCAYNESGALKMPYEYKGE